MVDLSHIQKQLEELESSITPRERADRDRRHQETLTNLAKQQERMWAPYRQMEQMLAPYCGMETALAPLRLAKELQRSAEPSPVVAALADLTRAGTLERSLAQLAEPSPIAAALVEAARVGDFEHSLGLSMHELLAESTGRRLFAELEAMRLQQQLIQDAVNPRSLIEGSLLCLAEQSPLESMTADLLRIQESQRELFSSALPPDLWTDEGPEQETVDEAPAESTPEMAPALAPSPTSLKERRVAAYYVALDDIRREPEDSLILDDLVERMCAVHDAMIRDVENGLY